MKEYKCVKIRTTRENTEDMLNSYAAQGWRVVCAYALCNSYLILERDTR